MSTKRKAVKSAAKKVAAKAAGAAVKTGTPMFSEAETGEAETHGSAQNQLRSLVERIERLEEEKKTVADDIKDIHAEAKSFGFDTKILRKVITIRKQDQNERAEEEAVLDTYLAALGMLPEEN